MKGSLENDTLYLKTKAEEFKEAIEKYHHIAWYTRIEIAASFVIIFLQLITLEQFIQHIHKTHLVFIFATLVFAYIATDFINGLVHMIVDNSANYRSVVGPFVAAFKLHHTRPLYQNKHPIKIYFYESGHKLWLVFYLIAIFLLQCYIPLNSYLELCLISIGLLSSIAELSHFWCHNTTQCNTVIRILQKYRVLLSMKHHGFHHRLDNVNYAFLNGLTDPILNVIASHCYWGYKDRSDKHVAAYEEIRTFQ